MPITPDDPRVRQLAHLLEGRPRCTIIAHFNPDGDAMGSSLGLAHVLRALGHEVRVVMPNAPPATMRWLPGAEEVVTGDAHAEEADALVRGADLLFCLDFNRPDRVHTLEQALLAAPRRVMIDHHRDPAQFAEPLFSEPTSPATCEMVFDIVRALGHEERIGTDAATCLYTGLVTDTGSFRFASTTAHTLQVAASLVERGAVPHHIVSAVMDDFSADRMRLLGFMLSQRMTVLQALGAVVIALGEEDLKRFNSQPGDTEGFVNQGLSIRGIRLSAFFMERNNEVKVSVRSKGDLPVDGLLRDHFAGGGHMNAAGGRTDEALPDAVARFVSLLPDLLLRHPAP